MNAVAAVRRSVRTRAEQLADTIGERIQSQHLVGGDRLGTLESLRTETGLAYATVSEAVRLLRDRGLLEIRPGRRGGLFVAERGLVMRLRHTLLDVDEEPRAVADAIELREHLEVLVDVTAARHRSSRDVTALRKALALMRTARDWDRFMHANWALHERIALIVPNTLLRAVYIGTLGQLNAATPHVADDVDAGEYRLDRYQIHADLVAAIAAGDEDAVRGAVCRHNSTI